MKSKILLFASLLAGTVATAQKNVTLKIAHKLGNSNFAFNTTAQNDMGQEFQVTRIDYYISGITLVHDGGINTPVPGKYMYVRGGGTIIEPLGSFNVTNVEGIIFGIGVDTPANNADPALQPAGSPLAFHTPSMHWGWSAGYRFVALEGKAGNGFTTNFELHGLWNENYFRQTVMAAGVNEGDNVTINLDADYTQALKGIDVASGPVAHGVGGADLTVLQNFKNHVFRPGSGTTSVSKVIQDESIKVYPNPGKGVFSLDVSGSASKVSRYRLIDINGRAVEAGSIRDSKITLTDPVTGVYYLLLYNQDQQVLNRKVVVE